MSKYHMQPTHCPICHAGNHYTDTRVLIAGGFIRICSTCSGYFLWPFQKIQYTDSGWTKKRAANWDKNVKLGLKFAPRIRSSAEAIIERPIETVLEIGCSSGYMAAGFEVCGCSYTGIDVDASSIEFAKYHSIDAYKVPIEDAVKDVSPLAGKTFDLVISSNVFEHVDDPVKAFEVVNLLSAGIIIIIVPNARGLYQVLKAHKCVRRLILLILGHKREIAY